ncbi:hypothetical protein FSP39_003769 [Pinctada imbricata]|uniref:IgGFc-binding protein N-terminal domain-containing protein n=1 Tax=Pinctada imbricata TaxID=66713 RepID=A0AA89C8C9_PINIB|nr:hypothetical protein FSP39_003769 [Pinctada imbricata]
MEQRVESMFSMLRTHMEEIRNLKESVTSLEKEIKYLKGVNYVFMQSLDNNVNHCNYRKYGEMEQQVERMFSMLGTQMEEIRNLKDYVANLEKEIKSLKGADLTTTPTDGNNQDNDTDLSNKAGQFGTRFLLTFPPVVGDIEKIQLLVVAVQQAVVQITSEMIGLDDSVVVSDRTGLRMDLPNSLIQGSSFLGSNVVTVTSSSPISLFVVLFSNSGAGDGYIAVPVNRLKTRYFFSNNLRGFISIAAEYDTSLSVEVLGGIHSSFLYNSTDVGKTLPFNITLRKGEMLQLISIYHVLGEVSASMPFSALTGSYSDASTSMHGYRSSYVESLIDLEDRIFIVPNFSNATQNRVTCISNTSVNAISSGIVKYTNGPYIFIDEFKSATFIKTNTISFCQYFGHGFSISIPGISSYGSYFRYITPTATSYDHHAAVIIESQYESGIYFKEHDSNNSIRVSRTEQTSVEDKDYDVLYYNLGSGQYEISHQDETVRFMVLAYGFGVNVNASYGFPVGFT